MSEEFVIINRVSGIVVFRGDIYAFKMQFPAAWIPGLGSDAAIKTFANASGCDMYTKV